MSEIQSIYKIDKYVYQVSGGRLVVPVEGKSWLESRIEDLNFDMMSPRRVKKISAKQVQVWDALHQHYFLLNRKSLESRGWAVSRGEHQGLYVVLQPEAYRKQTLGYMMGMEEKKLLGLDPFTDYTEKEIMSAFRKKARETHPDSNPGKGDEDFKKITQAKDDLLEGRGIGEMLGVISDLIQNKMCPKCMKKNVKKVSEGTHHCFDCGNFFGEKVD